MKSLINVPLSYPAPVLISKTEREVFDKLNAATFDGGLVLSNDPMFGYLATAYTPLRAWYSHYQSTPKADQRQAELRALFHDGHDLDEWRRRKTIAVVKKQSSAEMVFKLFALGYRWVYENSEYIVFIRQPAPLAEMTTTPLPVTLNSQRKSARSVPSSRARA
jgi:hypothetical protein